MLRAGSPPLPHVQNLHPLVSSALNWMAMLPGVAYPCLLVSAVKLFVQLSFHVSSQVPRLMLCWIPGCLLVSILWDVVSPVC